MKNDFPEGVKVEPWAKWVAQDKDGTWVQYATEPTPGPCGFWMVPYTGQLNYQTLYVTKPSPDWRDSLCEVYWEWV